MLKKLAIVAVEIYAAPTHIDGQHRRDCASAYRPKIAGGHAKWRSIAFRPALRICPIHTFSHACEKAIKPTKR